LKEILLNVNSICKEYGSVKAVDQLSFHVKRGEIFALLGPNGAGKTTTVRMMNNIIRTDSGSIDFSFNGSPRSEIDPSKLGYLPEERGLYPDIKILKTLTYFAVLRGMKKREAVKSANIWLEKMGLADRANDKLDTLSKGNQQKIQFISAVLHNPEFVILDEPFSGLDPVNQDFFLELISELRNNGKTIILSAHQMQMIERIADRILLINHGREVMQGTLDEIREESGAGSRISLRIDGKIDPKDFDDSKSVDGVEILDNGDIHFILKKDEYLNELLSQVSSKVQIKSIQSEKISLHDIFIQTVGGK
jgi:ABC-2 type transport system ATP-binding protein